MLVPFYHPEEIFQGGNQEHGRSRRKNFPPGESGRTTRGRMRGRREANARPGRSSPLIHRWRGPPSPEGEGFLERCGFARDWCRNQCVLHGTSRAPSPTAGGWIVRIRRWSGDGFQSVLRGRMIFAPTATRCGFARDQYGKQCILRGLSRAPSPTKHHPRPRVGRGPVPRRDPAARCGGPQVAALRRAAGLCGFARD